MIDNFVALSANERTYLAWVRTAIAIMAFGIVIGRIDADRSSAVDAVLSLTLVVLGSLLLLFAGIRFLSLNRRILASRPEPAFSWRFMTVFVLINATLVVLVAFFLAGLA